MKRSAWLVSTLLILTGCATAQKPAPVLEVCPRVPPLVLDAPERDFPAEMRSFLSGLLPTQPGLKPPSTSADSNTLKLNAR